MSGKLFEGLGPLGKLNTLLVTKLNLLNQSGFNITQLRLMILLAFIESPFKSKEHLIEVLGLFKSQIQPPVQGTLFFLPNRSLFSEDSFSRARSGLLQRCFLGFPFPFACGKLIPQLGARRAWVRDHRTSRCRHRLGHRMRAQDPGTQDLRTGRCRQRRGHRFGWTRDQSHVDIFDWHVHSLNL